MTQESGSTGMQIVQKRNTVMRIGDILLKAGIASSPVGATGVVAWEILQSITQHVLAVKEERDKDRALSFMETLLEGRPNEEDAEEILEHEVDPNDLYTLLRGALQDDEDAKTIHYAELLRKIALGRVQDDYKLYMVKAVRELSSRDIELLGKLYVTDRFNVMPDKGPRMDPKMLLEGTEVMDRLTNRNLSRLGLLDGDVNSLKPNSLTLLTAEILFRTSDLRPNALGLDQWREEKAIILTPQDDVATSFSIRIQEALRQCRIYSGFALLNSTLEAQVIPRVKEALILIVCIESKAIPNPSIDPRVAIKRFCMLQNDTVIKILASCPGSNSVDFASEIQASSELHVELSSNPDLSPLIERVNQLLDTKDAA
jgi:hypothetical protein